MTGVVAVADMLTTRFSLPGSDSMEQRYDMSRVPLLHKVTARGRVLAALKLFNKSFGSVAAVRRVPVPSGRLSSMDWENLLLPHGQRLVHLGDETSPVPSIPVYPVIPVSPELPIAPSSPIAPVVPIQERSTYVLDVEPPSLPVSVAGTLAGSITAAPTSPVEPSLVTGGLPVLNEVLVPADRCPATLRVCTDNGDCIHI